MLIKNNFENNNHEESKRSKSNINLNYFFKK